MSLDSYSLYKKYDPSDVGFGIERLPDQIRCAWHDTRELEFPAAYKQISHIVIVGMGGSALGPDMLVSALGDRLKVPVTIVRDYALPSWVGPKTLVLLSSFSGTTEEVLIAAKDAQKRKAKIAVICAGGQLRDMADDNHWPAYIFAPGDLAKQPRFGTGFSLVGVIGMLERAGLMKMKESELKSMMSAMSDVIDSCAIDVPDSENPAKTIAKEIAGKQVIIVASEHLMGNAHVLANSINETGKQFATFFALPELNHHLLEGFTYPKGIGRQTVVMMLCSTLYHERTQKRFAITADLFERQGLSIVEYLSAGDSRLNEVGEVLQFGSYVSWYLAMLNKAITTDTPFVDELKKRLSK